MIISKTPYRISFFGGGTDFPEWYNENKGLTISTTIDYHLYITVRYLPSFFKNINYRISYSKTENVKKLNQIKHKAIREYLKYIKLNKPLELHIDSDLPARSGLGSSSAFIVGLINSLSNLFGISKKATDLYQEAIEFEQNILNEFCGSQDQIITAIGGLKKIDYSNNKINVKSLKITNSRKKKIENSLVLFFTGFSRKTSNIEEKKIKLISQNKKKYEDIYSLALEAKKIFENERSNIDEIAKLLDESWKIKKRLSKNVSNSKIDSLYEHAIKSGAKGGKIIGAGNGGFFMFYVNPDKKKKLITSMKKLLYVPVKFTNEGSKIIYKLDEKIKV